MAENEDQVPQDDELHAEDLLDAEEQAASDEQVAPAAEDTEVAADEEPSVDEELNEEEQAVEVDERAPELQVLDHLQRQEVEARAADPTVSALAAVEAQAALAAAEVQNVEPDLSVQAMIEMQSRQDVSLEDKEAALARAEEVGASAAVQQALLAHSAEANDEQPLTQRPVELVDPLESGAGAGTLHDTSHAGEDAGVVVRTQRRPGAPLTDEQAELATFPSGPKDRDVAEEEQASLGAAGLDGATVTATVGAEPVFVDDDNEEDE